MNKIAQKMLHHKKGIVALFAVLAVLLCLIHILRCRRRGLLYGLVEPGACDTKK